MYFAMARKRPALAADAESTAAAISPKAKHDKQEAVENRVRSSKRSRRVRQLRFLIASIFLI
jgi:hypothetical protein